MNPRVLGCAGALILLIVAVSLIMQAADMVVDRTPTIDECRRIEWQSDECQHKFVIDNGYIIQDKP